MQTVLGAQSTADDVLGYRDLSDQRILITGVSSGVGQEMARALLVRGAAVIGTVRDAAKAESAVADLHAAAAEGRSTFDVIEADLASLETVRSSADDVIAQQGVLTAVIANAGIMATDFGRTAEGFELQFGTNHLGHFVLVNRLAPLLADGSRVVVLSSNAHQQADVDLNDPNFESTEYDRWLAYQRSKTANALFAVAFDERHRDRGVRACAVMPGTSDTGLLRNMSEKDRSEIFEHINAERAAKGLPPLQLKTVAQMAATPLWAAIVADADEIGGRYLENCHVAEIDDVPGLGDGVRSYALDADHAEALWSRSEDLVKERFPSDGKVTAGRR